MVTGLFVLTLFLLTVFANWTEQRLDAFPFMQEDWLRYQVPARFEPAANKTIMLTGPSTVRENLLYEEFKKVFPDYKVIQGGISLGTIEDVNLSLEFIEKAYGEDALPDILVMGISPRFIANIPDDRPFAEAIERYSQYTVVTDGLSGPELSPKPLLESLASKARFYKSKQPERFRIAFFALLNYWVNGDGTAQEESALKQLANTLFRSSVVRRLLENTQFARALDYEFSDVLAWTVSPYKYRLDSPMPMESMLDWMNGADSWWRTVHAWDPLANAGQLQARLRRLSEFTKSHAIRLFVINMPERDISRERYDNENYQAYLQIVKEAFADGVFVNMQEYLQSDEFYDLEHTVYPGSQHLTAEVLRVVESNI